MKITIRLPISVPIPNIVQAMVDAHIIEAAQEVLGALPEEIERLKKLGQAEIAQALTDLQHSLQEDIEGTKGGNKP